MVMAVLDSRLRGNDIVSDRDELPKKSCAKGV